MTIPEELAKQSGGVLQEAYKDLVHPAAQPTGEILSFLPRTIRRALCGWEKWLINGEESLERTAQAVRDKANKIPLERQCEPDPSIAIPAIQQISYCYDSNELREMYANLLVRTMDSEKKSEAHPSYVELIKQITPDEAKLLKTLVRDSNALNPVVDVRINKGASVGFQSYLRNYSLVGMGVCEYPERGPEYLENLARLKVIEIPEDLHITDDRQYAPIEESDDIKKIMSTALPDGWSFEINRKVFYLSNYGLAFIKCCVEDYAP